MGLLLSGFMVAASVPAFAVSDVSVKESKLLYQSQEIKNVDKLFERAKNGVSDIESDKEGNGAVSQILKNKEGKQRDVRLYKTTQKLKEIKLANGETETQYATTVIASVSRTYDGNRSDSGSDVSVSVKSSSTFYWSNVTINGISCIKHQGASGSWVISDSNISISNRQVELGGCWLLS